jgi:hypothetical protein
MSSESQRRTREDKADEIPKAWRDGTFSEDKRDVHRIHPPPQKYREWLVSKRTLREAHEALPLYRIPQQAYLLRQYKSIPKLWAEDTEGRLYTFVPNNDEAYTILGADCRSGDWLMYVVLNGAQAEFPRDKISLIKPSKVNLSIDFSDFQQHRAVGIVLAKKLQNV